MPRLRDIATGTESGSFSGEKKISLKTLEYGCGGADFSVLFAKRGHKPTICDVEKGNIVGAQKRFQLRSLEVKTVFANQNSPVPSVDDKFDLIIATEVLEHIRNPLKLLELIYKSLDKNGIVVFGSFPFNKTDTKGDHLEESVSKKYQLLSWINIHFIRISDKNIGNAFFKN